MAVTPLSRNAISLSKWIKSIEKTKVPLTDPAYLQQLIAFVGGMFRINAFLQSDDSLFFMHFCDGSEARKINCKNYGFC